MPWTLNDCKNEAEVLAWVRMQASSHEGISKKQLVEAVARLEMFEEEIA